MLYRCGGWFWCQKKSDSSLGLLTVNWGLGTYLIYKRWLLIFWSWAGSCFSSYTVLLNLESDVITEYLHIVLEFSLTDNLWLPHNFVSFILCFISVLICIWKKDSFRLTALGNVNVLVYRALGLIFLDRQVSMDGFQDICDPLLSNKYLCRISVCLYKYVYSEKICNFFSDPQRFCVDKRSCTFYPGFHWGEICAGVSSSHSDGFYISRLEFIFSSYEKKM